MTDLQPTPTPHRASPTLLVFLVFPLLGLVAVFLMALGEQNAPRDVLSPRTPGSPIARIDWQAPNFLLNLLDGTPAQLSDYRGRVVFLNFWATYCEPCVRELPAFQRFQASQHPDTGALVLAVNVGETADEITAYFQQQGIVGLTVILDPVGVARSQYGVLNIPVTFVIDRDGIIRFQKLGEMTAADIADYLAALASG